MGNVCLAVKRGYPLRDMFIATSSVTLGLDDLVDLGEPICTLGYYNLTLDYLQ